MVKVNGTRMRERREELGLTQAEAAAGAGMANKQYWYRVESGQIPMVAADTLYRIARTLKTKMEKLLTTAAAAEPEPAASVTTPTGPPGTR